MDKIKSKDSSQIRLNLFISKYSFFSRRQADFLIKEKKVTCNGHVQSILASYVNPRKDVIKVKGKIIKPHNEFIYIAFNKPARTLTTTYDSKNRPTVFHYLEKLKYRVFSIGRLDWNTEGLLLFTNDGMFADRVMNPRYKLHKTYMVKLDKMCSLERLKKLTQGVTIPGGRVKAVSVQRQKNLWIRIVIQEGKNRQLHYMFKKIGFNIDKLRRVSIGKLHLRSLKKGEGKYLTQRDLLKIFNRED